MKIIFYLFPIMLISMSTPAQSTLNLSGGSKVIDGNTHSYSIGEMTLVHTTNTENIVVTQGLLQATPTSVGIADNILSNDELNVYPNPTRGVVHLELNMEIVGDLTMYFFDIMGRELIRKEYKITSGKESYSLSLQGLASGNYILRAEFKDLQATAIQNFKIQKS